MSTELLQTIFQRLLSILILTTTLWIRFFYRIQFTAEETEQKCSSYLAEVNNKEVAEPEIA